MRSAISDLSKGEAFVKALSDFPCPPWFLDVDRHRDVLVDQIVGVASVIFPKVPKDPRAIGLVPKLGP